MKHTQGEWEINHQSATTIQLKGSNRSIASTGGYSVNTQEADRVYEENLANAKLISAAPELLEALKEIINDIDVWNNLIESHRDRIINAINKATL